jgi:transcriptional antiterminator NusG
VVDSAQAPPHTAVVPAGARSHLDGPFTDFSGVVKAVFPEQEMMRVAAIAFGRSTPTEVSFSQVEKVDS